MKLDGKIAGRWLPRLKILLPLALASLLPNCESQPWYRTYMDVLVPISILETAAAPTRDGGFIVAGEAESPSGTGRAATIHKLDAEGEPLWSAQLCPPSVQGFSADCFVTDIGQAEDGSYFGVVAQESPREVRILLVDEDGRASQTVLPVEYLDVEDNQMQIEPTEDGGFLFWGGPLARPASTEPEAQVFVKLDENLAVERTELVEMEGGAVNLLRTSDGGLLALLERFRTTAIVKLDADLNVEWEAEYWFEFRALEENGSGEFLVGGWSFWWDTSAVIKLDRDGALAWELDMSCDPSILMQTGDSEYLGAGAMWPDSDPYGTTACTFKFSDDGTLLWGKGYPGRGGFRIASLQRAPGGGYFALGAAYLPTVESSCYDSLAISSYFDSFLAMIKIDEDGNRL